MLVCSEVINKYAPTRVDKEGRRVCIFTGPQVEELGMVKLDLLGLKNLDVLDKCIKSVDPTLNVEYLYKEIVKYLESPEIYEEANAKKTEGLFQIESGLFKGLIENIRAKDINDICAILAIGRPGPLQAGMDKQYANRKNGFEEQEEILKGTGHLTSDTYNCIIYQEHLMMIAKHVALFNDSQSDSIIRKATA